MDKERREFRSDFRRFFGRGLTIVLPSVLTLWILWYAAGFLFRNIAEPINSGLRAATIRVTPEILPGNRLPKWYRINDDQVTRARAERERVGLTPIPDSHLESDLRRRQFKEFWDGHWYLQASGLLVAIVLIYLSGRLLGGFIGRKVYARLERLIGRVPGFKQIYPHVKQLVDMVMGDKPMSFKRVIMVEYPSSGIWSLGLVTSGSFKAARERVGGDVLTVFIPSTPTPFTGFTINVPADRVIDVPMSIDEALRFVLTGGVLIPEHQANEPLSPEVRELAAKMASGAAKAN